MPRPARAFYDKRAGCWASSAIGDLKFAKDGKPYRDKVFNRELTHPTRDEVAAQAWLHAKLMEIELAKRSGEEPTFFDVSERYIDAMADSLGPETFDRRSEQLDRFGNWPGKDDPNRMYCRLVDTITRGDGERFKAAMVAEGLSESYITDGLVKAVKSCLSWAASVEPGRYPGLPIASNPFADLKGPTVPSRRARVVDTRLVDRFVGWAWRRAVSQPGRINRRHAKLAVILLMALRDTGARPKDLCVAEWHELRTLPDGWGLLVLPPWKWKNGAKTGKDRIIAIPPHCMHWIEWIRRLPGRHESRIFTHRRGRGKASDATSSAEAGEPWVWLDHARKRKGDTKQLQQWFRRLRKEGAAAGHKLPPGFRLYFNRSYYATQARRLGVNEAALAKAMGTSVRMLDTHYTDLDESDVLGVSKDARARGPRPPAQ
jgi:hypothetical protein